MRHNIFILCITTLLLSCGQNDTKQKELDLKQKELELRERELALKEKDTTSKETVNIPIEKDFVIGTFPNTKIPAYFDNSEVTFLYLSQWSGDFPNKFLFVGKDNGKGLMNINNELVELKFVSGNSKGKFVTATFSNSKYKVVYNLDYRNASQEVEEPQVPGTITIEGNGFKKYSKNIFGEIVVN